MKKLELIKEHLIISFDENLFVVGYDSGNIEIYSGKDISLIKSINERKSRINVIKCSKNNLIACATQDEKANNIIDVYFTSLNKFCTLLGAQNKIDGLDWSEDSKYLVTFKTNGSSSVGGVTNQVSIGCDTFTNVTCTIKVPTIEREGFEKLGFNTNANATTGTVSVGAQLDVNSSNSGTNYYAITKKE